ncbi:MAG: multiubiquitin domain-containing protein [Candidatus Acidiferrales bacterium]
MPEQPTQLEDHRPPRDLLTVTVNGHKVFFHVHKASGAEIKSTAIAQHVQIQLDFNLFEKRSGHPLKPIGDADIVELHEGEEFRAVAPDDNSGR